MTHTHADRVAERDPCMCTAYGCPLMGTMTGSTSGANDWSCSYHVNKGGAQRDEATLVLNRYRWLAAAITDIRSMVPGRAGKAELLQRIGHDFGKAGRNELYWNGRETVRQWVNRLEAEFDKLVYAELEASPAVKPEQSDSWQNAGAHIPQWA